MLASKPVLPFDGFGFLARFGAAPAVRPILPFKGVPLNLEPLPTARNALETGGSEFVESRDSIALASELLLPLDRFGFLARLGAASAVRPVFS